MLSAFLQGIPLTESVSFSSSPVSLSSRYLSSAPSLWGACLIQWFSLIWGHSCSEGTAFCLSSFPFLLWTTWFFNTLHSGTAALEFRKGLHTQKGLYSRRHRAGFTIPHSFYAVSAQKISLLTFAVGWTCYTHASLSSVMVSLDIILLASAHALCIIYQQHRGLDVICCYVTFDKWKLKM